MYLDMDGGMRYRFSALREIYRVWEYAKLLAVSD